jgi:membrane-bound serine protease (ClpP class)
MNPFFLILLLIAAAAVLFLAELILPAHGVLGIGGLVCLVGAVGTCFYLNRWAGLIVLVSGAISSPILLNMALRVWEKSPVGRRIILQPFETPLAPSPVKLGQIGIAATGLRPMGECDFGEHRLEAISELDIVEPGQRVRVVSIENGRPVVRVVGNSITQNNSPLSSEKETS